MDYGSQLIWVDREVQEVVDFDHDGEGIGSTRVEVGGKRGGDRRKSLSGISKVGRRWVVGSGWLVIGWLNGEIGSRIEKRSETVCHDNSEDVRDTNLYGKRGFGLGWVVGLIYLSPLPLPSFLLV